MPGTSGWLTPNRILLLLLAPTMVSPCGHRDAATLVLGVTTESVVGGIAALHVVVRMDGAVADDETIHAPNGGRSAMPPWEKTLTAPPGDPNAQVDVSVEAIGNGTGTEPLLTRLASTRFVPASTQPLLRVPLESRCAVYPPPPPGSKVPGPLSGPKCAPPATCIFGTCQSPVVPAQGLEAYAPGWPKNAPDRCKPRGAGSPVLYVGTGQSDYLPLVAGQTLQAEAGPQGGHHIWIATRMKNIKQALSTTRIEGVQPDTGTKIPPSTFVFTYVPGEGGFCRLYGLRYQLDNGGIDYKQFLGKALDVNVTVTDTAGTTATTTAHIQVAPTLVGAP